MTQDRQPSLVGPDIISELQEIANFTSALPGTSGRFLLPAHIRQVCKDAADEIEKLREQRNMWRDEGMEHAAKVNGEVKRLREGLDHLRAWIQPGTGFRLTAYGFDTPERAVDRALDNILNWLDKDVRWR